MSGTRRGSLLAWVVIGLAALPAASCRGAPRRTTELGGARAGIPVGAVLRSPRPGSSEPFAGELLEALAESRVPRSGAGATKLGRRMLVKQERAVRLNRELLPAEETGARHITLTVLPGVSIPMWVQEPETIDLGYRRWRAEVDDDPEAWVGIIASPVSAPLTLERPLLLGTSDGPDVTGAKPVNPPTIHVAPPAPVLASKSTTVTILVRSPVHGDYEIHARSDGMSYVVRAMDYSVLPPCGLGSGTRGARVLPIARANGAAPSRGSGCCGCCRDGGKVGRGTRAGDETDPLDVGAAALERPEMGFVGIPSTKLLKTINLMLLFTAECVDPLIGTTDEGLKQELIGYVAYANDAMEVADTRAVIECVVLQEVTDVDQGQGTSRTMLTDLSDSKSMRFGPVHAWRDHPDVRADIVCLVACPSVAEDECGVADVADTSKLPDDTAAFSVVRHSCLGGLSLPHEIGHNFGCCHDPDHLGDSCPAGGPIYRYASRFTGDVTTADGSTASRNWTSLMGYTKDGHARVKGWSSPYVHCGGAPMGEVDKTDNARMIRETAQRVAGSR